MEKQKKYLLFYIILSITFNNIILGMRRPTSITQRPTPELPFNALTNVPPTALASEPPTKTLQAPQPPTATDILQTTNINTPVEINVTPSVTLNTTPACPQQFTLKVTKPTNGTAVINPGNTVMYTPNTNFSGSDVFQYTATQGSCGSVTKYITVNVSAPTTSSSTTISTTGPQTLTGATNQNTPTTLNLSSNINTAPNCTKVFTLSAPPANGIATANPANNTVTYRPNPNFSGTDTFTYTINQGTCGTVTQNISVTVNPAEQVQPTGTPAAPNIPTGIPSESITPGATQETSPGLPAPEAASTPIVPPPSIAPSTTTQAVTPTPSIPPVGLALPAVPETKALAVPALPTIPTAPKAPKTTPTTTPTAIKPIAPSIPAPSTTPVLPTPQAPPPIMPGPVPAPVPTGPELPALPGAELPEIPPAPEPDIKLLKPVRPGRKRPVKEVISMADKPENKQEEEFVKKTIGTTETYNFENAPQLDPVITKQEQRPAEKSVYLGQYLEPWRDIDPTATIEMNFDNKEISELLKFLEDNLKITFITDDDVDPQRADGLKPIAGTRISFKSHVPLTMKEVWNLGLTFLEMSGFAIEPTTLPRTYHITDSKTVANRDPLPTFIGTDPELLPNSDAKIRYVYFIENADIETISKVIDTMRSGSSGNVIKFPELKAVIMTDKSANIKSLMKVIQEIDQVTLPETLAIIRLKHADATRIQDLYTELIGKDTRNLGFPFRQRKSPTTQYFSETTRVFAEPRTNSLIVLGTRDNIKKFEEFIFRHIDKKSDVPFSPLHIVQLRYIDSDSTAKLLNDIINNFNSADPARAAAAAVGGVRDGNKFFKPTVKLTSEPSGNRLIINADYEDYLKLQEIIDKLDVEQPQVAIKVLVLDINLTDLTQLGTQLRNKRDCCVGPGGIAGNNVNFQTSGVGPLITRETANGVTVNGAERLLGNLINLAALPSQGPGLFSQGTTLVTLGRDIFGFWGLLRMLESYARVSVVANPFLVTSHKYKAEITIGETRRVLTAIVTGQSTQSSFGDLSANLSVVITPQISYDDMIKLNIYVDISNFVEGGDPEFPSIIRKQISTEALTANKEAIALGGLIRDRVVESETKVPLLGDIPLVGWLFKNKTKTVERTSLLILISPEIIKPHHPEIAKEFTNYQLNDAKETLYSMEYPAEKRDPIHRWLFRDNKEEEVAAIDNFVARQERYLDVSQKQKVAAQKATTKKPSKSILDFVNVNPDKEAIA